MKSKRWIAACGVVLLSLASATSIAGDHDRGKGKYKGKSPIEYRYSDHDRESMRVWYRGRNGKLPPGLAKRDRLSPGLENQLVVRGTLPPGLRKKMWSCPREVVQLLPPPDYGHFFIGGHIVLVNRHTYMVLDIFRF